MSTAVSNLMLQFLEWVAASPRTYPEAMAAWRTSCPRLSVWEDAWLDGLVQVETAAQWPAHVVLTQKGQSLIPRPS